jgi:hypothetical protein
MVAGELTACPTQGSGGPLSLAKRDARDDRIQPHTRTGPGQHGGAPRLAIGVPRHPAAAGPAPAWRGKCVSAMSERIVSMKRTGGVSLRSRRVISHRGEERSD